MNKNNIYKFVAKISLYVFLALIGTILISVGVEAKSLEIILLGVIGFIGGLLALFLLLMNTITFFIEEYVEKIEK